MLVCNMINVDKAVDWLKQSSDVTGYIIPQLFYSKICK